MLAIATSEATKLSPRSRVSGDWRLFRCSHNDTGDPARMDAFSLFSLDFFLTDC